MGIEPSALAIILLAVVIVVGLLVIKMGLWLMNDEGE